ncbi:MAG: hypothetical protein P8078_00610, partial [bacterium]
GCNLGGEIGISSLDLNLYSSQDDNDNLGIARSANISINQENITLKGKKLGGIEIKGMIRSIGDNFRPFGRITEVEHGRKWGASEGEYWSEDISQLMGVYKPWSGFTLKGETGLFKRNSFSSDRKSFLTELKQDEFFNFNYYVELIETEQEDSITGTWLRQNGDVRGNFWGISPFIAYLGENRRTITYDSLHTGFRFQEWQGGVSVKNKIIDCTISRTFRDDDKYQNNVMGDYSLSHTDQIRIGSRISKDVSTEIMYTHHSRKYANPQIEDKITDLADMKMKFFPWQRSLEGTFFYKFSSTHLSEMVRDTIKVGRGLGMYRYDENLQELVPDTDGDLILRNIQTGKFLPVNEVQIGGDVRLKGDRIFKNPKGFKKFLGALDTKTTLKIEREEKNKDFRQVNQAIFNPQWGEDSLTVLGRLSFFQDLEYNHTQYGLMVRLRYKNNTSEDHQLLDQGVLRKNRERSLTIKGNPAEKIAVMFEFKHRKEEKDYDDKTRRDRNITAADWWLDLSYRPEQKIELKVKTRYVTAENTSSDPAVQATSLFLIPSMRYAIPGRGHIKTEVELGRIFSEPAASVLPYEMLSGDQPGNTIRWSAFFTYRISGHIMATLHYRGRSEPWRTRIYQTGKVEARIFF